MRKNRYVGVAILTLCAVAMVSLVLTGCKGVTGHEHPEGEEHPAKTEHPAKAEHPSEHPAKN